MMRTRMNGISRGMTLVEMLVSMVVLTILGSAIAAVMVNQVKSSASVQSQSIVQSDVNLALSLIRSDINQAGYGNATDELAGQTTTHTGLPANLTLAGSNLGGGTGHWTVVNTSNAMSGTLNQISVRWWSGVDTINNVAVGDSVKVISGLKQFIGAANITAIGDGASASEKILTLSSDMSVGSSSVVTQVNENLSGAGLTGGLVRYTLNDTTRQLLRNGLPFLDNVEAFQVRYFWDRNGDGLIDSTGGETDNVLTINVDPGNWNTRPLMVGVAFVTVSPTQERARVDGRNSYTIWGTSTGISAAMGRRYRNFYSLYARPRNIGG